MANFKGNPGGADEAIGQRVEIDVSTRCRDHPFYGTIDSFSPGSGATFALLPPDNATGNFTAIVQRVPVSDSFLDPDSIHNYEERLVPGLSLEANVDLTSEPQQKNGPEKREHAEP